MEYAYYSLQFSWNCAVLEAKTYRWSSARFVSHSQCRQNYLAVEHRRDFVSFIWRKNYHTAEHRWDFGCFIIQTELPSRWTSEKFGFFYYSDRIDSPLNIGEIFVPFLPRRWTSARFWFSNYADRISSPLNIGEILIFILFRQIPRRRSSARMRFYISVN